LEHGILRSGQRSKIVRLDTPGSQFAGLSYRCLAGSGRRSLVEIDLETGRHHQIRLQFSHIGHPVVGDLRYGAPAPLPRKQIALLSRSIAFDHPTLREPLEFTCPLPAGWLWPEGPSIAPEVVWNWSDTEPARRPFPLSG
jgi:23S rRNA pseudouridine1911/1915/1917 synthase